MIEEQPAEQPTGIEPENAGGGDVESLKKALDEAKVQAETNLSGWQRIQADFLNYKRRTENEKEETVRYANTALMLSLLPVLDDLERAFASVPVKTSKQSWLEGVILIERKLRASLEAQGLSPIEALGEPFDPNLHEAVMHEKGSDGIIIREMLRGYKLYDRVIRPSRVVVGNGEEDNKGE